MSSEHRRHEVKGMGMESTCACVHECGHASVRACVYVHDSARMCAIVHSCE